MNHAQYVRAMRLALDGDEQAWHPALNEALRRQDRERQFQLLQLEVERNGHPEWEVPETLNPVVWFGVELCWNARTARLFAADCAERVLHLFEEQYPEDMRPREAIRVARAYAMGQATLDELGAALDAAGAAVGAAAWAAGSAARAVWFAARAAWFAGVAAGAIAGFAAGDAGVAAGAIAGFAAGDARAAAGAARAAAGNAAWFAARAGARAAARAAGEADERSWQRERLAQYLLGEVIPCWEES